MLNSKASCIQMAVMSILTIISADGACSWCNPPDIVTCGVTDSDDWTLARAIGPSKGSWFDNTDSLQGTDPAVDNNVNQYNIGSFEAEVPGFNQFLFVTGDCSSWLITSKDAVGGPFNNQYYSNAPRTVCASSKHPTQVSTPRWYNRNTCCAEDPWISTTDHGSAVSAGDIVYGERNFGSTHANTVIGIKNGVYVYIRSKQLDANGCSDPCSECDLCAPCVNGECVPKSCSNGMYCDGEEYCDQSTGECESGAEVDCPENMFCDDDEDTCMRDCDSFAIDEYLVQCSNEFEGDQNDITELQADVERIDGDISEITGDITGINGAITSITGEVEAAHTEIGNLRSDLGSLESTVNNNNIAAEGRMDGIDTDIETINDDLKFIHSRIDGFKPFNNAKANAEESTTIGSSLSITSGYFDGYKDEIIIGLLLMNMVWMVAMIVSCFMLSKRNNKRYTVVSMQESDDEQRALKQ